MIKLLTTGIFVGGALMASSISVYANDAQSSSAMGWAHPNVDVEKAPQVQSPKALLHAAPSHPASSAMNHRAMAPAVAVAPEPVSPPAAQQQHHRSAPHDRTHATSPHFMLNPMLMGGGSGHKAAGGKRHHGMGMSHYSLHWGYAGIGAPQYWGDLKEDYVLCKEGRQQSPVDISAATITSLPDIQMDYKNTPVDILNNGHAIQVNYGAGSDITVAGKTYHLLQFHFHSPSEHTIGGKAHDMVAHLVHKADDGQLAVIAVMIDGGGPDNAIIGKLWSNFPAAKGEHNTPEGVEINVADLLPRDLNHFNYSGSLTTPPCSEGVNWFVLSAPVLISDAQLSQFRSSIFNDARPVQPLNGRAVRLGN